MEGPAGVSNKDKRVLKLTSVLGICMCFSML